MAGNRTPKAPIPWDVVAYGLLMLAVPLLGLFL